MNGRSAAMRYSAIFLILILIYQLLPAADSYTYDITMMGRTVGKSTEIWKRTGTGKACRLIVKTSSQMAIPRGSSVMHTTGKSTVTVSCDDFSPRTIVSSITQDGIRRSVRGSVKNGVFHAEITRNGKKETHSFPVKDGMTFLGFITRAIPEKKLLAGGRTTVISEESLSPRTVTYTARKKKNDLITDLSLNGVPVTVITRNDIVVKTTVSRLISYQLRGTSIETAEPPGEKDILRISAIPNKGMAVKNPRKMRTVSIRVTGGKDTIRTGCAQTVKQSGQKNLVTVDTKNLPHCSEKISPEKYLTPSIYEEIDAPEIQQTTARWSSITDKRKKIQAALRFVHGHITKKDYEHASLSALETFRKRAGDCTEHATLLSALLKAMNIPVRMLYGVVMANQNEFMFHNWNEVYVDGSWLPVDATFNTMPADAVRIVLARGGTTSSQRENVAFTVLRTLNTISLSVESVR